MEIEHEQNWNSSANERLHLIQLNLLKHEANFRDFESYKHYHVGSTKTNMPRNKSRFRAQAARKRMDHAMEAQQQVQIAN